MAQRHFAAILQHARWLVGRRAAEGQADLALLDRFVQDRDEGAFAALVERHGPLVLGTCWRVLGDAHAAEDTFQATFLVLARKAAGIRQRESIGGWLYRVAYRLALAAKGDLARRQRTEREAAPMPSTPPASSIELAPLLDEEVNRLPEKYRLPVVLCYLQGRTSAEAAQELGWPHGTVMGRLARARDLLRRRLTARGLALAGATVESLLGQTAEAAVPLKLREAAIRSALAFAAGPIAGQTTGPALAAAALIRTMGVSKMKAISAAIVVVGAISLGTAGVLHQAFAERSSAPADAPAPAVAAAEPAAEEPKVAERYLEPLPANATARLRTMRLWSPRNGDLLAFSPDATVLAAEQNETLFVWDVATGQLLRRRDEPTGRVLAVAFSPDGRTIALGHEYGPIVLWDATTGKERKLVTPQRQMSAYSLTFSPDGKTLAQGGGDNMLHLWDLETAKEIHAFGLHKGGVSSIVYSPDGKTLASCGNLGDTIGLWNSRTGDRVGTLEDYNGRGPIAFSPDGKTVIACTKDAKICQWEAATGKLRSRHNGPKLEIRSMSLSRDGRVLALSDRKSPHVHLWDVDAGKELRRVTLLPSDTSTMPAPDVGYYFAVAVAPDGKTLAGSALGREGPIVLWDVATGKELPRFRGNPGPLDKLALSHDAKTLLTVGGGTVCLWDRATGKGLKRISGDSKNLIRAASLSPKAPLLAIAYANKEIRLLDLDTGKDRLLGDVQSPYGVSRLAFSPDGTVLASLGGATFCLWDVAAGKVLHRNEDLQEFGNSSYNTGDLAWSSDSKVVARDITLTDGRPEPTPRGSAVTIVNGRNGDVVERIDVPLASSGLSFSADGKSFVCGSVLYDRATGKKVRDLADAKEWPQITLSPNGKLAAVATLNLEREAGPGVGDAPLRVVDVETGRVLHTFNGHRSRIVSVAFSADGKLLVSGSADGTVFTWDMSAVKP
ncbi:MAG: sigma-70 family RNA polymerase sigma factor [Gemmataceae bacterium]|nr:sigma-70 family RNA polymerase sigma factor [Gemmataceae bacterium]